MTINKKLACPECKSKEVKFYFDADNKECYLCDSCEYTNAKKEFIIK